ncbi:MAG: cation transporter [Nitrospirae bacterium]|nr:cation transporter [Nitrospirota bacterium]
MAEIILNIEGMSCQHCTARVKKAIDALAGIEQSDVQIGSAVVRYDESKIKRDDIAAAVEKAGYRIAV